MAEMPKMQEQFSAGLRATFSRQREKGNTLLDSFFAREKKPQ
jgi:hypothetical protein